MRNSIESTLSGSDFPETFAKYSSQNETQISGTPEAFHFPFYGKKTTMEFVQGKITPKNIDINEYGQSVNRQATSIPVRSPIKFIPEIHYSIELQHWDCVVLSIGETTFAVRMRDGLDAKIEEFADISKLDVSTEDLPYFLVGAVFYLSVGYRETLFHSREKYLNIRFRRGPINRKKIDLEKINLDIEKLFERHAK